MRILAIAKVDPRTTPEMIQPHMPAEVKQAWKLYKEGSVREMYSCPDRRMGVVFLMECNDTNEARMRLDELPFVREKLIDFDCIALGPFAYFESLFRSEQEERGG